MMRVLSTVMVLAAGATVALTMTQIAAAQRGGGRGPGGRDMISSVDVAAHENVQAELNLTDEQKQQIEELRKSTREERRRLRDQEGGDRRGAMRRIGQSARAKLTEVLDDDQEKRVAGILIQVDIGAAMDDPYVAVQLDLTDEQKAKLEEARQANRRAMRDSFQGARDLSREERRAKMEELRSTADENIKAVLTPEQQAKLEELKGEPVEINRWELMGGRGERGRRGGDRNQSERDDSN